MHTLLQIDELHGGVPCIVDVNSLGLSLPAADGKAPTRQKQGSCAGVVAAGGNQAT